MITFNDAIEFIKHNQTFAGFGLASIFGGLMYKLKEAPTKIHNSIDYLVTQKLHVSLRKDKAAYKRIDSWLAKQITKKRIQSSLLYSKDSGEHEDLGWRLVSGFGKNYFWWNGNLVFYNKKEEDKKTKGDLSDFTEDIYLTIFGRSNKMLEKIIEEAFQTYEKNPAPIMLYNFSYWSEIKGKKPRRLNSLIYSDNLLERILEDVKWFISAESWYEQRSIPYRRGYLFSGAPGTGKTSVISALGVEFSRPVCIINLASIMRDSELLDAVNSAPSNAFVVIEDIDCAKSSHTRESKNDEDSKNTEEKDSPIGVSKSGLLNVLDGITTPDGRIFIMTTNFPENLDAALIRPGRADVHFVFNKLGSKDQIRMANNFYPAGNFEPLSELIAPAYLQAAFMQYPNDPQKARELLVKQLTE